MNSRNNSYINSSGTLASSSFNSSANFNISPLIKLERLVQRLNLVLSKDSEAEAENQLKLLLQYQSEISKLKDELQKVENVSKEFEGEDRIKWVDSKIEILNKFIKELNQKKRANEVIFEPIGASSNQLAVVGDGSNSINNPNDFDNSNTDTCNNTQTLLTDILPPKPENSLLSLPKSKESASSPKSIESLVFSEEIQSKHDNLTNELIATVQLIKRNNLNVQKMVKSDEKIISEATGLLATNSDSMQKQSKNLNSYSKKAWVSFWKMILILLFVSLAFVFVYIFIRLT